MAAAVLGCWCVCRKKLGIDPTEKRIVLTEPPMNPSINREKMLQIMFEKYNFKAVYVGIQAMLTLYAQGRLTAVVAREGLHYSCSSLTMASFAGAIAPAHAGGPCYWIVPPDRSDDWCRRRLG